MHRSTHSSMTKKRKATATNPLRAARKSSDLLWRRKCGTGYSLFVQYYGQQPIGAVVTDITSSPSSTAQSTAQSKSPRAGMSRAAKRRRQRKGQSLSAKKFALESTSTKETPSTGTDSMLIKELNLHSELEHLRPFISSLSKPLPLSFRLRDVSSYEDEEIYLEERSALQQELKQHSELVRGVEFDATIYQSRDCSLNRASLARASPSLKKVLVESSSKGILARQEIGSMLPILGLQQTILRRGHRVLDTCASPGSKTLQMLEVVGPKGRVLANDVNASRTVALKAAVERAGVPTLGRILYKNHDASLYPSPQVPFDVVVADVPCSGDGTIRKDWKTILPGWTPATARALHVLQLKILLKSLELVKVGGFVSYSTCSLNPIEDEAVVQGALLKINGAQQERKVAVELVPWPIIDGLVLQPGISDWKVVDTSPQDDGDVTGLVEYKTHQEAAESGMKHAETTMFPSARELNLHHCRRLFPQDQNTGGFFVALIKKNAEF